MKNLYLIILFVSIENLVFGQAAPTSYCTTAPSSTEYADIDEVIFGTINNKTNCTSLTGSQGTGTGTVAWELRCHCSIAWRIWSTAAGGTSPGLGNSARNEHKALATV